MPVELSPELLRHYKAYLAHCWNTALDSVDRSSKLTVNEVTGLWISEQSIEQLKAKIQDAYSLKVKL